MATITSVQDGDWNTAGTWDSGTVPTANDAVDIKHRVTFKASIAANSITIRKGGQLYVDDSYTFQLGTVIEASFVTMTLERQLNDNRRVNLDGCRLSESVIPSLASRMITSDGFPYTPTITGTPFIFDDPGFISSSAILRDIKPEGCTPAYAEKVSNAVRYLTVTIHIDAEYLQALGVLYRMARGPFQVLLVTHSCLIKGFIESVVPDPASVGKEYIAVKVTVTEGPGA